MGCKHRKLCVYDCLHYHLLLSNYDAGGRCQYELRSSHSGWPVDFYSCVVVCRKRAVPRAKTPTQGSKKLG